MSHNKIKIAGNTPSAASEINLNIADIGSFTSTTNKQIGFDGNGDLVQLDPATSSGFKWLPTYHLFTKPSTWGGGGSLSVGDIMEWRKSSGVLEIDSTYASDLYINLYNAVWANKIRLQAGNYLLNASFAATINTNSDQCILRLKNETDNTFHGNHASWGASQYSNNIYAYVSISAPKTFSFMIESIVGSPSFHNSTSSMHQHLNVWRFA